MKQIANQWIDYECIDCGDGYKLERWNDVYLSRPDPQVLWKKHDDKLWKQVHAHYLRSKKGGGHWDFKQTLPDKWTITYKNLCFKVSPTNFKHTGIFPEQAANWDVLENLIKNSQRNDIKVLNLFAYTGGATMACASAGAQEVVHVDASKGMISWAKENMELSNLAHKKIRFIVEDVLKFVAREKRRGRQYDIIIMDPPSYGRGPNNEVWKIEEQLYTLIEQCSALLSDTALCLLVNTYTTGFSATVLKNVLCDIMHKQKAYGHVETGENCLAIRKSQSLLPCGIYGRWIHTQRNV
ncbi:MAG: class I SAM-dependent methyltransferase [Breznakia sp.]